MVCYFFLRNSARAAAKSREKETPSLIAWIFAAFTSSPSMYTLIRPDFLSSMWVSYNLWRYLSIPYLDKMRQVCYTRSTSMRRTKIVEEMFVSVATAQERKKAEMLWDRGNKGSWTIFQLRVVKTYWDSNIRQKKVTSAPSNTSEPAPRFIKINHMGISRYERLWKQVSQARPPYRSMLVISKKEGDNFMKSLLLDTVGFLILAALVLMAGIVLTS